MGSKLVKDGRCGQCKDRGIGPLRRIGELHSGERGFPLMRSEFERTQVCRSRGQVWCRYQVCGCPFGISFDDYGRPHFENLRQWFLLARSRRIKYSRSSESPSRIKTLPPSPPDLEGFLWSGVPQGCWRDPQRERNILKKISRIRSSSCKKVLICSIHTSKNVLIRQWTMCFTESCKVHAGDRFGSP